MSGSFALFLAAVAVHVLTGVFWTGSAFVLARFGPRTGGPRLRRVALLAGTVSVLLGAWLWLGRGGGWTPPQARAMALGAIAAILAAGVQSGLGLRASRQLEGPDGAAAGRRLVVIDWITAILMAIALLAMVMARYL